MNKTPFSRTETRTLLEALEKHGNHWAKVAIMLPGRSDNAIKNRWHSLRNRLTKYFAKTYSLDGQDAAGSFITLEKPPPYTGIRGRLMKCSRRAAVEKYNFHNDLEGALAYLYERVAALGPFDGLCAYSQGANLGAIVAAAARLVGVVRVVALVLGAIERVEHGRRVVGVE